jgi:hypothetical protein
VTLSPRASDNRCEVRAEGRRLLVDPSLPPPGDEGPLAAVAEALRAHPGAQPVVANLEGAGLGAPGAGPAVRAALRAALSKLGAQAADPDDAVAAAQRGSSEGDPAAAWLEERLLLLLGPERGEAPDPDPGAGLLDGSDPAAWLSRAQGQGLTGATACEEDRAARWTAAGLLARWPIGAGAALGLCAPERRGEATEVLAEHGYATTSLRLQGVLGAEARAESKAGADEPAGGES